MLLSHGEALEGRPGQPEARGAGRFPGRRAQGVVSLWKGPLGEGFPETSTIIHPQHLVSVSGEVRQADRRGWKQPPGDWHQQEGRSLAGASCLSASGWRWRAPAGPDAGLLCPCVVLPRSSVPSAAPALCPSMPHPVPLTWSPWPPLPHLHAVVLIWG